MVYDIILLLLVFIISQIILIITAKIYFDFSFKSTVRKRTFMKAYCTIIRIFYFVFLLHLVDIKNPTLKLSLIIDVLCIVFLNLVPRSLFNKTILRNMHQFDSLILGMSQKYILDNFKLKPQSVTDNLIGYAFCTYKKCKVVKLIFEDNKLVSGEVKEY